MPTMRETVDFPFNIPVALKLKYSQGKPCQNGERVMYSTADNRVIFLDPAQGQEIEALNIKPGEPILITRQKNGKDAATWLIQRAADLESQLAASLDQQRNAGKMGQQPDGTYVVPALPQSGPQASPKPAGQARVSTSLLDESTALIDTFAEAWKYAREKYQGAVKPEEVRALVVTAYIQRNKSAA